MVKRGNIYAFKTEGRQLKLVVGDVKLNVYGTMVGETMNLSLLENAGPIVVNVAFSGNLVQENGDVKNRINL